MTRLMIPDSLHSHFADSAAVTAGITGYKVANGLKPGFVVSSELVLAAAASEKVNVIRGHFLGLLVLRRLNGHRYRHRPHLLRVLIHGDYLIDAELR